MTYQLIVAEPGNSIHKTAILGLWKRNLRLVCDDRYDWLYANNPAGSTITLLAVHEDQDRIVGCASIMRRDFVLDGKMYHAGLAIDFAVDAEFRVFGPALLLQRSLMERAWEQGLEFIIGFPNKAAQGVVRRVGYELLGEKARFTQIVNSRNKLQNALPASFPNWLITAGSAAFDAGLMLQNSIVGSFSSGVLPEIDDDLDERWQKLWDKNAAKSYFGGNHGLDYMRWRYVQCPYRDYHTFQLSDKQGGLLAHLVFSFKDDAAIVENFMFFDEKYMLVLFSKFWREMRNVGLTAISVEVIFNGNIKSKLLKAGFVSRPMDRSGVIVAHPDSSIDWKALLSKGNWYVPDGELDL